MCSINVNKQYVVLCYTYQVLLVPLCCVNTSQVLLVCHLCVVLVLLYFSYYEYSHIKGLRILVNNSSHILMILSETDEQKHANSNIHDAVQRANFASISQVCSYNSKFKLGTNIAWIYTQVYMYHYTHTALNTTMNYRISYNNKRQIRASL